jgi:hypothetical protein
MKRKLPKSKLMALLLILSVSGLLIYYLQFKTITNDDILAYGWKGGVCDGLPEVLDFRNGRLTLRGNDLYLYNKWIGRIVKREYRTYDDGYIEIRTEADEICSFWAKWKNKARKAG